MPLSQRQRPLTVVESVHVPSFSMRPHGSPLPAAGVVHWTSGCVLPCCAGPRICSKHTPPLGHAQPAPVEPEPSPEPVPDFDPHAPGEHTQLGSFGGHAQPVPYQVQSVSAL